MAGKKPPSGKALFDPTTERKHAEAALASGNVTQYAKDQGISVFTLRRYISKLKKADGAQLTHSDKASYQPAAGAPYRARSSSDLERVQQLERENRELKDTMIQVVMENARLKGKNKGEG